MSSQTLLNSIGELSSALGEIDSDAADIRSQIKTFMGELPADDLVELPADFDVATANNRLMTLMQARHKTATKLAEANEKYQRAIEDEAGKLKSSLLKRYRDGVRSMIETAIAFAESVTKLEALRDEARDAFSQNIGFLVHVGPPGNGQWDVTKWDSAPSHFIREAISHNLLSSREKFLEQVTY